MKAKYKPKYRRKWQKFPGKPTCHPKRKHYSKGLCQQCYNKKRFQKKVPSCHPNNSYHSKNKCASCYYKEHKKYYNAAAKAWRKRSPWNVRKVQYNMTREQLEKMYQKQKGKCKICKAKLSRLKICVDHDHKCCPGSRSCGQCVRGLLCRNCNNGIAFLQESIKVLKNAIKYLGGEQCCH